MSTRNFVPRADGEGSIGTTLKKWSGGFFNLLDISNGSNSPFNTLQRNTEYSVGDVARVGTLNFKLYLECIEGGVTGNIEPLFDEVGSGDIVNDGTVVWETKSIVSKEYVDYGNFDVWKPRTEYLVGDVVKTPTLSKKYLLYCISSGVTGNTEQDYSLLDVGSTVSDGTAEWVISELFLSTGGNVSGTIFSTGIPSISHPTIDGSDSGQTIISGGHDLNSGASLLVFGNSSHETSSFGNTRGSFVLNSIGLNGESSYLLGRPDGTLSWHSNSHTGNVLTSIGGQMSGDIVYTPNSLNNVGSTSTSKVPWVKGATINEPRYCSAFVARDNSNLNSNDDKSRFGLFETSLDSSGVYTYMSAYKNVENSSDSVNIGIGYDSDSNWYTKAPTPLKTDNTTKIATTAFVKNNLSDYLSLAGGTMTGDINYFAPDIHSPDYSEHIAVGKCVTNRYGTKGTLPSSDYAPIYIPLMSARDTSDLSTTDAKCRYGIIEGVVYPDGGTNLSFRVYKNATDSTDNACLYMDYGITSGDEKQLVFEGKRIDVKAVGTNYIRYGNGLQICWGNSNGSSSGGTTITFPVSFNTSPSVIVGIKATNVETAQYIAKAASVTTSNFKAVVTNGSYQQWGANYIAIGTWK